MSSAEHIARETIAAPDDEEQWILGNVGCYGFYRVNYDDIGWRALISQLNKDHQVSGSKRAEREMLP